MDNFNFNIPAIAEGRVLPPRVQMIIDERDRIEEEKAAAEKRADEAERKAASYFKWGIVCNILCMIGGFVLGKIF